MRKHLDISFSFVTRTVLIVALLRLVCSGNRVTQVGGDEGDEEDGDVIERILWHQHKGVAASELASGGTGEPCIQHTDPHVLISWEDQEFYVKWKGQSYIHCQWQLLADLCQVCPLFEILCRLLSDYLFKSISILTNIAF